MSQRSNIHIVSKELFQASLVTYMFLMFMESMVHGFVSNFFNINYLLAVVVVTGIAMVLSDEDRLILKKVYNFFSYPTDEISNLVAATHNSQSASTASARSFDRNRPAPRVMDFSKRSINRLSDIKLRSRPPVQQPPTRRNTTIDIVKK